MVNIVLFLIHSKLSKTSDNSEDTSHSTISNNLLLPFRRVEEGENTEGSNIYFLLVPLVSLCDMFCNISTSSVFKDWQESKKKSALNWR